VIASFHVLSLCELHRRLRELLLSANCIGACVSCCCLWRVLSYTSSCIARLCLALCMLAGGKPHILFDGGQKQLKKYPKVWVKPRYANTCSSGWLSTWTPGYNGVFQQ
jgi:hypothetical protein